VVLLCLTLWTSTALANRAPGAGWKTVTSTWCDIHLQQDLLPLKDDVVAMCDEAVRLNANLLDAWPSERIQVVLSDVTESENGYAITVPRNHVHLFGIGPDGHGVLSFTDDYLRALVLHEVFHIVHIEIVSGLAHWVNRTIGKSWPPNQLMPTFLLEGMAVYAESKLSAGGRNKSPLIDAMLRVQALDDNVWNLGDLTNPPRTPPGANGPYLYGGRFVAFLVERHGEDVLRRFVHDYGGTIIPYAVQRSFHRAADVDLDAEYEAFRQSLLAEAKAHPAVQPDAVVPAFRQLTRLGGVRHPVQFVGGDVDTGDHAVFVANPPNQQDALFHVQGWSDPSTSSSSMRPRPLRPVGVSAKASSAAGQLVVAQVEYIDPNRLSSDLFVVDDAGPKRRLTRGARLRDPAVHPDGKRVFAVQFAALHCALVEVDLDTGAQQVHRTFERGAWVYTPAVSPNGDTVVVSVLRRGGARQLMALHVPSNTWSTWTTADAQHLDPTFTPDGRTLVYATSASGTFNIVAHNVVVDDNGHMRLGNDVVALTNTAGAATRPTVTPDGTAVVFVDVHAGGTDYFVTSMVHPRRGQSTALAQAPPASTAPPVLQPTKTVDADDYNPLTTVWPRRFVPVLQSDVAGGLEFGVDVTGADAAEWMDYRLTAHFQTGLMRPYVNARFRWLYAPVPITASVNWTTQLVGRLVDDGGAPETRQDIEGSLDVSLPLRWTRFSHSFGVGVTRGLRIDERTFNLHPQDPTPRWSQAGNISAVRVSWSYTDVQGSRDGAATEIGQRMNVRGRFAHPLTLAETEIAELSFDARFFRQVPGLVGHSVMLQVAGAYAIGDRTLRANYRVGGFTARDLTLDVANDTRLGLGYLRGYPANVDVGDGYWLTTVEWRLPVLDIETGFNTLPIAISRLTGAAFVDVGDAFDGVPHTRGVRFGAGVEGRLLLVLGYYGRVWVRAGIAQGLLHRGVLQPYALLGTPF